MKLKTWQKWGIVFGGIHVIVYFTLLYIGQNVSDSDGIGLLLGVIHFPVLIFAPILSKLIGNSEIIIFLYFLIFGTIFYGLIGISFGLLSQLIGEYSYWIFKVLIVFMGILLLIMSFLNLNYYTKGRSLILFIIGLVTIMIGVSSLTFKETKI